jgi:putative membrane protein
MGRPPMFMIKWFVMTIAVLIASYIVPGIHTSGVVTAIIAALVLGLVNIFIKPLFILLTLPFTIATLGIFLLFVNAFMLYFVAGLVDGLYVNSLFSAFIGSIIISIVATILSSMLKPKKK